MATRYQYRRNLPIHANDTFVYYADVRIIIFHFNIRFHVPVYTLAEIEIGGVKDEIVEIT